LAYRYGEAEGVLLTKKWGHNRISGGSEILAMYAVPGSSDHHRCFCLRFTIFDYAAKQFVYIGVYKELKHLQEFDVQILSDLAKASLDRVEFERAPFKLHILCLESIIKAFRVNKLSKEKLGEPKRKVPVEKPKPETRDAATSMLGEELYDDPPSPIVIEEPEMSLAKPKEKEVTKT
jgi:hypothetical protein